MKISVWTGGRMKGLAVAGQDRKEVKKGQKTEGEEWIWRKWCIMESHMVNLDIPSALMGWGKAMVCVLALSSAVHALYHTKMPHRLAVSDQYHILIPRIPKAWGTYQVTDHLITRGCFTKNITRVQNSEPVKANLQ